MSKVWSFIIIISITIAIIRGVPETVIEAIIEESKVSVNNILSFIGMLCFWTGIFKIFENTSLLKKLSKMVSKLTDKLFNKNEINEKSKNHIAMNITSNLLGIGNAATVHGLKAMEEMDRINTENKPNNSMTKFVLLNTASIQLVPTTMISLRMLNNSNNPTGIVVPVLLVTCVSLIVGIISITILNRWY